MCILGESTANHVSCDSLWQWAKHEFMNIPPLIESLRNPRNAKSMSRLKPEQKGGEGDQIKKKKKIKLNSTTQLVTITCEFNNSFLSSAWNFLCYLMKPVYIHSKKELNNNLATFLSGLHHMLPDPACNDSSVHADQQNLAPIYYETVNINIFTPCKI